ncbi:MAG TPA: hypothetical protein VLD83_07685 [Candidatus Binatia bacterium]|nr:hypothetical protein [Candidatus Binatia bacterium]
MSVPVMIFLTLIYPLAVWLGQKQVEPSFLAGLLILAGWTRLRPAKIRRAGRWWLAVMLVLSMFAVWNHGWLALRLYPVLVNATLLGVFAYSLIFPPSMIERFARMNEPNLPVQAIGYTRRVTQIWCVFFGINGAIALMTALWASPAMWALYNGLIAYLLMGLLLAGESVVRRYFKRQLHA